MRKNLFKITNNKLKIFLINKTYTTYNKNINIKKFLLEIIIKA
jgi:hypothetical protein